MALKRLMTHLGHEAGDQLLRQVANRFTSGASRLLSTRLHRLGGDEFGVVAQIEVKSKLTELAQSIRATLKLPNLSCP